LHGNGQRIEQPRKEVTKRKRREDQNQQEEQREFNRVCFRRSRRSARHRSDEGEPESERADQDDRVDRFEIEVGEVCVNRFVRFELVIVFDVTQEPVGYAPDRLVLPRRAATQSLAHSAFVILEEHAVRPAPQILLGQREPPERNRQHGEQKRQRQN
jgi:hypothetical protein